MQDRTKQGPEPRIPDPTRQGFDGDDRLYSGDGDDVIYGGDGADIVSGDGGNDYLYGDYGTESNFATGNDTMYGGHGNDYLFGAGGNDELYGGTGDDVLEGGTGNDTLSGGEGVDFFIFDLSPGGVSEDTITDFEDGVERLVYSNLASDAEFFLEDAAAYKAGYDGAILHVYSASEGSLHTTYLRGIEEELISFDDIGFL